MPLFEINYARFNMDIAGDDSANIFGLDTNATESNIILIPVPWEATVSYGRGTKNGPAAIKGASPQLDFYSSSYSEIGLSEPWKFGIYMEPEAPSIKKWNSSACKLSAPIIAAGGNIGNNKKLMEQQNKVNQLSEQVNNLVKTQVSKSHDNNKIVGVIGGDHSVSYGAIAACANKWPQLGILHIDAHADLRAAYEGFTYSHASIMNNVIHKLSQVSRLVQVGIRDYCAAEATLIKNNQKIKTWFDINLFEEKAKGTPFANVCQAIINELPEHVYVSFDIDGLCPTLCPNTGTPVPGGLSFLEAIYLLKTLAKSGKIIVGFDLVEVSPAPHKQNEWDGNVAARILYEMCAATLYTHGARN